MRSVRPHGPYRAPTTDSVDRFEKWGALPSASRTQRFANMTVDTCVWEGVAILMHECYVSLLGAEAQIETDLSVALSFASVAVALCYYWVMERAFGQTVGKFVTRTRVVSCSHTRPTERQLAIRTFCRLVPLEAVSFFGAADRGWHDRLSNTRVIRLSRDLPGGERE